MKIIDMTCPKCGATLKPDISKGHAVCEYCGHQVLIEQEDTLEETRAKAQAKSYGYHKGKLQAEEEASRKAKLRNIKPTFIVIAVILLIGLISAAGQHWAKPRVNPFECIDVTFQGKDGQGKLVLETVNTGKAINLNRIDFEISKETNLLLGETVTIQATSNEYRLTETTKDYVVEGLDEYLKDLEDIPKDALEILHLKAESSLDTNLKRSKNAGLFTDMKPVKLFLITDGKQTNRLYDVYEAYFSTNSGEKTFYVAVYFDDVIVRNGEQVSLDVSSCMYFGNLTQVQGSFFIMAYDSLDVIRADILTSQDSPMELKELDL